MPQRKEPSMPQTLSQAQIDQALRDLPEWAHENDALVRHIQFGGFREAISFIVRLSFEAEERNHHPELTNVYNKVTLRLSTHDAGGKVTQKDVDLARAIQTFNWQA